jgi:hypothetical protein
MMSMNNIPQTSIQRFLSEQPSTTMTLISSSNTVCNIIKYQNKMIEFLFF